MKFQEFKLVLFDGRIIKLWFNPEAACEPVKDYFRFLSVENRQALKGLSLSEQLDNLNGLTFNLIKYLAGLKLEEHPFKKPLDFEIQKHLAIRLASGFILSSLEKKSFFYTNQPLDDLLPYFIAALNGLYEANKKQFLKEQED